MSVVDSKLLAAIERDCVFPEDLKTPPTSGNEYESYQKLFQTHLSMLALSSIQRTTAAAKAVNHKQWQRSFGQYVLHDTHASRFLGELSPDLALCWSDRALDEFTAALVIELQGFGTTGKVNKSHLGQLLTYNQLILSAQPFRTDVTGVATTLTYIVFIHTRRQRNPHGPDTFHSTATHQLRLNAVTWRRLILLLYGYPSLGWALPALSAFDAKTAPVFTALDSKVN